MEKKNTNKPVKPKKKRRSPIKFIREVWGELKKITWPTGKELASYTFTVLAFIALMGIIIGALDYLFGQGLSLLGSL